MLERIARKLVFWLIRYAPDYIIVWRRHQESIVEDNIRIRRQAEQALDLLEPLKAENDRLRKELDDARNAYVALLEEVAEVMTGG